ncbi:hypothetical protein Pst134EA_023102 [Puccinia striiformis f. sp. tritici]|uniref:hypothetical protein n=1 Tax=Puccinia striiformis f. sp. tritici TaxID=168172 RepID=UPI002007B996|nr:hypothetical protein Pst134EA_023102 [Puccinia striiformis f. sp. tritici]KAH9455643.1 hypothetical protein Pst134EA_023102 [Puccinia striiformis f. sp. tritici]
MFRHSSISNENQSLVFRTPPAGVRKIVISTNIAETGITIPDVTCVIDSGKHKEMRYDEKRQIIKLVETFIARSNVTQRKGRAGRVQEGISFHLFTKHRMETHLADNPLPEMLRLSLQDLALRIKIMKIGTSIEEVLLQALILLRLPTFSVLLLPLVEVKALTPTEEITPLGRHLVKLPMDVLLFNLKMKNPSLEFDQQQQRWFDLITAAIQDDKESIKINQNEGSHRTNATANATSLKPKNRMSVVLAPAGRIPSSPSHNISPVVEDSNRHSNVPKADSHIIADARETFRTTFYETTGRLSELSFSSSAPHSATLMNSERSTSTPVTPGSVCDPDHVHYGHQHTDNFDRVT